MPYLTFVRFGHGTLSDVGIFSLSGVEPDIQVQGKFTLFGGARLFFSAVLVLSVNDTE